MNSKHFLLSTCNSPACARLRRRKQLFAVLLLLSPVLCPVPSLFAQGSLTPLGAPSATMKTLDQVEARKPIDPTQPGFALPYDINTRGSYYLTGNVTASAATVGIRINTDDVSLDLNGFTLNGNGTGTIGIQVVNLHTNIAVSNGALSGWTTGIQGSNCNNSQFSKLRISNSPSGISVGSGNVLNDCSLTFGGGSGSHGVVTQGSSTIRNCVVVNFRGDGFVAAGGPTLMENCIADSNGGRGFFAFGSVVLKHCVASQNTSAGFRLTSAGSIMTHCTSQFNAGPGIDAALPVGGSVAGSEIEGCTIHANQSTGILANTGSRITGNHVTQNLAGGIYTNDHCTIRDNSSTRNEGGDGIRVTTDCVVTNNYSSENGVSEDGPWDGFFVNVSGSPARNVFDGNHARGNNSQGINCSTSTGNTVTRNMVNGNVVGAISVGAGNDVAPIGTAAGSTSPWANISN